MKQVRIENEYVGVKREDDWQFTEYKTTLKYGKKQMTVPFKMGMAHTREPEADDVLYSLISDSAWIEHDFEEWADSLGYDTDSRKAEKIYNDCKRQTKKLFNLLGDDLPLFEKKYEDY